MSMYLLQISNGIGIGMLYFLLAVGLSIVFGLLGLAVFLNFMNLPRSASTVGASGSDPAAPSMNSAPSSITGALP